MTDEPVDLVTIRCEGCGPGLLPATAITLRINIDSGSATVAFPCRSCGVRDAIGVGTDSIDRLRAAGVEPEFWSLPHELREHAAMSLPEMPSGNVGRLANELEAEIVAYLRIRHPTIG